MENREKIGSRLKNPKEKKLPIILDGEGRLTLSDPGTKQWYRNVIKVLRPNERVL